MNNIAFISFYAGILVGYAIKNYVFASTSEVHPLGRILERLGANRKEREKAKKLEKLEARIFIVRNRITKTSSEANGLKGELLLYQQLWEKNRLTSYGLETMGEKRRDCDSMIEEVRLLENEFEDLKQERARLL